MGGGAILAIQRSQEHLLLNPVSNQAYHALFSPCMILFPILDSHPCHLLFLQYAYPRQPPLAVKKTLENLQEKMIRFIPDTVR